MNLVCYWIDFHLQWYNTFILYCIQCVLCIYIRLQQLENILNLFTLKAFLLNYFRFENSEYVFTVAVTVAVALAGVAAAVAVMEFRFLNAISGEQSKTEQSYKNGA